MGGLRFASSDLLLQSSARIPRASKPTHETEQPCNARSDFREGEEKMEANEAQELQEHAEHGAHESSMRPIAFTMSVLAVLVAVASVLGHRAHTEAILGNY